MLTGKLFEEKTSLGAWSIFWDEKHWIRDIVTIAYISVWDMEKPIDSLTVTDTTVYTYLY